MSGMCRRGLTKEAARASEWVALARCRESSIISPHPFAGVWCAPADSHMRSHSPLPSFLIFIPYLRTDTNYPTLPYPFTHLYYALYLHRHVMSIQFTSRHTDDSNE
ncbi:hypothetical protein DPX39_100074800 [Trypanosoma brucei equiperdum]|uniref:Uncharacterized protein n=1 Tax=Trypanosoma brucei equiperdum TaxID=630700 RepID=A0A3L6KXE8_9TRYP|nr:hypothetical protein DPX39_100074800 [Trypanosoma brucei equiperdum]